MFLQQLFAADMRLIWSNCEAYNSNNPMQAVYQAGIMFQRMFDRLFQVPFLTLPNYLQPA